MPVAVSWNVKRTLFNHGVRCTYRMDVFLVSAIDTVGVSEPFFRH